MAWQLWVLIALAAAGLVLLAVVRMRHARRVFDDITDLDRPMPGSAAPDELGRARARHVQDQPARHRKHG
jgi:hypothetical protein